MNADIFSNRCGACSLFLHFSFCSSSCFSIPPSPSQEVNEEHQDPLAFISKYSSLNKTISEDKTFEGTLVIKNMLNKTLEDISLYLIGDLEEIVAFSPETFMLFPSNEQGISIVVNKKKSLKKESYSGALVAAYQGFSLPFPMAFTVQQKSMPPPGVAANNTPAKNQGSEELENFFNYSVVPQEREKQYHITLIAFIIILALGILVYILLRKSVVKKQTFAQYIKKMEKK